MGNLFSKKSKREAKQVLGIISAWLVIGAAITAYDYSLSFSAYVTIQGVSFVEMLVTQLSTTLVSGLITGTIIVKYFIKWIRYRAYGQALLMIGGVYTFLSVLTAIVSLSFFFNYELGLPLFSQESLSEVFNFIFGLEFLRIYSLWLLILLGTILTFLINDKYGPGVFKDFLLGKYFRPRRTERIFMFLDLRGSTSIAEKLGEVSYFEFLQAVFIDVTPAIIYAKGEIYQYVGDEIVINWKMEKGLKDAACIFCFLEIQKVLVKRSQYYQKKYGITPEFKAGLHCGYVMAGELGVVKREITFSGDVLNTTARIQGKCNDLGVDILFSQYLYEKLNFPENSIMPKKLGDIALAGKQKRVSLFTV